MSGKLPTSAEVSFDLDQIDDLEISSKNNSSKRSHRQQNTSNSEVLNLFRSSKQPPRPPKIITAINSHKFSTSSPEELIQHLNFVITQLESHSEPNKHDKLYKNLVTDKNLNQINHTRTNQHKITLPEYLSELLRLISQKVSSKYGGNDLPDETRELIKNAVFEFVHLLRIFDRIFSINCVRL